MTPGNFRKLLQEKLESAGVENAGQESLWFCAAACGISPADFSVSDQTISPESLSCGEKFVQRRIQGEPLQYILGNEYFGGYNTRISIIHALKGINSFKDEGNIIIEGSYKERQKKTFNYINDYLDNLKKEYEK